MVFGVSGHSLPGKLYVLKCPLSRPREGVIIDNDVIVIFPLKYNAEKLADRLLLVKCYDIKRVKSPGCPSIGVPSCG